MSGLYHFTLSHSGLRGSLHTLDGLPYVGPPNVCYDMVVTPLSTGLSPARFGALIMAHEFFANTKQPWYSNSTLA
jgi:hypothetical protein